MTFGVRHLLAFALLCAGWARADVINYQGRLSVGTAPFTGIGEFRFEIVSGQGAVAWSSGDVSLNVNDGRYAVRLGESAQTPPIAPALGQTTFPPNLRIWFKREGHAWAVVGPDVALAFKPVAANAAGPAPAGADGTAILTELRAIHALLAGTGQAANAPAAPPAPPPPITMPMPDAPSLGQADAPVVLIEFLDYQCPYCVKFHNEVFPQMKAGFVDTGKLRLVSAQLPLPFHPFADGAARAAACAREQGKFWEMRERMFAASGVPPAEALQKAAQESGLDVEKFLACFKADPAAASVKTSLAEAKAAGIEATPTFVLGRVADGKITGVKIIGALPFANFAAEINKQLALKN